MKQRVKAVINAWLAGDPTDDKEAEHNARLWLEHQGVSPHDIAQLRICGVPSPSVLTSVRSLLTDGT